MEYDFNKSFEENLTGHIAKIIIMEILGEFIHMMRYPEMYPINDKYFNSLRNEILWLKKI